MVEYRIALLGFGNVGRAFLDLLARKSGEIERQFDLKFILVGVATGSHGMVIKPDGLSISTLQSGPGIRSIPDCDQLETVHEFLDSCQADVLLEAIPVNYADGQPALGYLKRALQNGMHIVSANKGPVVHGFTALSGLAAEKELKYRFESAVMDGAPIFSMWREALPALRLESFEGVLNSTTNYILKLVEEGETFQGAIAAAQQMGIAETDPNGDLEGWDAAVKVAALITVLMQQPAHPQKIERTGISHLTETRIRAALDEGKRWKLVCRAAWESGHFQASVRPELVNSSSLLYHISGTSSAITFKSDALGDLTIIEANPGPSTTAYGMLSDLLSIVGDLT